MLKYKIIHIKLYASIVHICLMHFYLMKVRNNLVFFLYCDCSMNDVSMKYLGNIRINLLNIAT